MPYPTGTLSLVLEDFDREMISIKAYCQRVVTQLASGPQPGVTIIDIHIILSQFKQRMAALATTPGLIAYAKAQKNNDTLDVVAEYQSVIAAVNSVISNIEASFPKDADGYLLKEKWSASGGTTDRTFSAASTNTLRTLLNAVIATIA